MKYLFAFLLCSAAMADVSITTTPGKGVDLFRSGTKVSTHPDDASCRGALLADAEARKIPTQNYSCRKNWDTLTAKWTPTPVPVACSVSDFGPWQDDMTSACTGGMLMTSQTRSRSITRPAANGGTACPALTENRTVHKACGGNIQIVPIPPRGTEVYTTIRVQATTEQVDEDTGDLYGGFRVPCAYSHMAYDDPIVFAGSPGASHLHVFFGNTSTDANSTQATLDAGNSTCRGGTANRSAYWTPSMIDTGLNQAVVPTETVTYYKGDSIIPATTAVIIGPPKGLKMIAGNPVTWDREMTGWGPSPNQNDNHHQFECWSDKLPNGRSGKMQSIPAGCPVGGEILFELHFPQCWDGKNLDSQDHRSHMAYTQYGVPCPATHPVAIAGIAFNIHYPVREGNDTSKWRLSSDAYDTSKPGGYSAHGDVWIDWDQAIEDEWVKGCLQSGADCHAHMLGDGRMMY